MAKIQVGSTVTVVANAGHQTGTVSQILEDGRLNVTLDDGTEVKSIAHTTRQNPQGWYSEAPEERAKQSKDKTSIEVV